MTTKSAREMTPLTPGSARAAGPDTSDHRHPGSARALHFPVLGALAVGAFSLLTRDPRLDRTFLAASAMLLGWCAWLYLDVRRSGRSIGFEKRVLRQHWMQACAHFSLYLWWGWHTPIVYPYLPFLAAQLCFAYAFDSLLAWTRRNTYAIGFGPFPIIFSTNLFLWFRLEHFHWQLAMVAVAFAAKELIRWKRDGQSTHVFNPSSFPLTIASLLLLTFGATDITLGPAIATTQSDTPHFHLAVFLVSLGGQLLFGVARMTLSAAVTMYAISVAYFASTGTYLFYDTHIPPPVFLGMHLLFTDPATSPRSEMGRMIFGAMYAIGTIAFFVLLEGMGLPTFYDKLLPVPLMNLTVRGIDRLAAWKGLQLFDPARIAASRSPMQRNAIFTGAWAVVFFALLGVQGVGNTHPGQYYPFWQEACQAGSARACTYGAKLTVVFCANGSGWACNEAGALKRRLGQQEAAGRDFARGCGLGFAAACENRGRLAAGADLVRARPEMRDLPVVLAGSKPPLKERDPAKLMAIACRQGWAGACSRV